MHCHARTAAALAVLFLAAPALARDDRLLFPISEALATDAAKSKIDPGVKLYFGKQKHPAAARSFGHDTANRKTNAMGKTDKLACEWVFLSAVLSLQERARKEGADAVVNIVSVYKDVRTESETEYMCGAGSIVAGVALRGELVKLAK